MPRGYRAAHSCDSPVARGGTWCRSSDWQAGQGRQGQGTRQTRPRPRDGLGRQSRPARQTRSRPQGNTNAASQAMAGKEISPSTPATAVVWRPRLAAAVGHWRGPAHSGLFHRVQPRPPTGSCPRPRPGPTDFQFTPRLSRCYNVLDKLTPLPGGEQDSTGRVRRRWRAQVPRRPG